MSDDISRALEVATKIREEGINTDVYLENKKIKAKFKYADKIKNTLCSSNWRGRREKWNRFFKEYGIRRARGNEH